ncbi:type II toxin-antitoxin system RelE/ParE family toxin [Danxiaibacter flavus]|uniref:Type II toxin-antitoxin system RelE/ParE family toxin n=2 Tax=Danxiaibacter flavus TaxID=3049108 RepID=A0ABV3ZBC1_9BACT|nr:type II toxin-antitoxin system RelE/ParE family toxin [Chitinophagaceae bacterium DXS]
MSENPTRCFQTEFLPEIRNFFKEIDKNAVNKILWNLDLAERTNDSKLFKKLRDEIWEFRTKYGNLQYRLLAFWDQSSPERTLVIATHGIIKKTDKMPSKEIEKAISIRKRYFEQNSK